MNSFHFGKSVLIRFKMDLGPIPGTLDIGQKYILNRLSVHDSALIHT